MLETESRKCLDKNEEKFWANWTIIQKPEWSRHVEGIPSSWTTNLGWPTGGNWSLQFAQMNINCFHEASPQKKSPEFPWHRCHRWFAYLDVSRSLDGFFVHAFVSASFPRKASNISLDFYFLDFIVNNKSQVTKQQNNFGFLVEMDKNGEQQDTKL